MGVCAARVELGVSFPTHIKRFVFQVHLYAFNLWFISHSQSPWRARLRGRTSDILLGYENLLRVELKIRVTVDIAGQENLESSTFQHLRVPVLV